MKKLLLLMMIGLLSVSLVPVTAQDDDSRAGVFANVMPAEGVSENTLHALSVTVPVEWRAESAEVARYEARLVPTDVLLQSCTYYTDTIPREPAGTLERHRVDVSVEVVDLATGETIATEDFTGTRPDDCPETRFTTGDASIDAPPDYEAIENWLREVLTDAPSREPLDSGLGAPLLVWETPGQLYHAAFSPDEALVMATGYVESTEQRLTWVWDVTSGDLLHEFPGYCGIPRTTVHFTTNCFSPDGTRLVTANNEDGAWVWDSNTGEGLLHIEGFVSRAEFSHDGTQILTGDRERDTMALWDSTSGEQLIVLNIENNVGAVRFSPRGGFVAARCFSDDLCVWNISGELVFQRWHQGIDFIAFSSDGEQILVVVNDMVTRWDIATGERVYGFGPGRGHIWGLRFGDGVILTYGGTHTQLWDEQSGDLLFTYDDYYGTNKADFSPNSDLIAGGTSQGSLHIWQVVDGQPLLTIEGHRDAIGAVDFSADGTRLLTAGWDGKVVIWDVGQ